MTLRIEIQEQPERDRFFAEVEVGGMVARRKLVATPRSNGLRGHVEAVLATVNELAAVHAPHLVVQAREPREAESGAPEVAPSLASLPPETAPADEASAAIDEPVDMDALRAEAEAAGVDVDRRWGEARLRREIAAAAQPHEDE